jgi:mono/diheme cytochrome c family protein
MVLSIAAQKRCKKFIVLFLGVLTLSAITADQVWAQETAAYFKANCASCHTIGGGRLTGPDLKGVSERAQQAGKDRDWLITYIQDPQRMINSGDPYAARLLQEARGVVMPRIVGLDAEKAEFLIDLIDAESLLEESQFKGAAISNEPFTARDVQRGLALFTGGEKLKGGSAMCMSCHRMPGVGALGGGNLGPDLSRVYEKGKHTTGGRAVLSAWLNAPATPTMQALLKDKPLEADEIHAIVALMENRAAKSQPEPLGASMVSFAILGLLGSALTLFAFDSVWKTRLRSVRRAMVEDSKI